MLIHRRAVKSRVPWKCRLYTDHTQFIAWRHGLVNKYVYSSKYVYGPIHRHSEYHTTNSQVCRVGFLSIDESTCKSVRFVLPLRFIHMIDGDACPIRGMRRIGVSYLCWWEGGGHSDVGRSQAEFSMLAVTRVIEISTLKCCSSFSARFSCS